MEIQDERPRIALPLDCIGFRGIKHRLIVESIEAIALDVVLDVCISIKEDRRGAHLSRNYDAVIDVIGGSARANSIEYYLDGIASRLLERHEYAVESTVIARTTYYALIEYGGVRGLEPVDVEVEVSKSKDGRTRWRLSVGLYGMTVCPSAQERIRRIIGLDESLPAPSHSQKAYLRVSVENDAGRIVRIEELSSRIARAFSAPTISLLKRNDEAELVLWAHRNPRFAEDVVREAIAEAAGLLLEEGFPDTTLITAEIESFESIHPQNVYARATLSLGEVASMLSGGFTGISTKSMDS